MCGHHGTRTSQGGRGRPGCAAVDGRPPPASDLATRNCRRGVGPVYSSVVLSGLVRLVEFVVVLALGATIYMVVGLSAPRHPVDVERRPVRPRDPGARRVPDRRPLRHPRLPHPCRPVRQVVPRLVAVFLAAVAVASSSRPARSCPGSGSAPGTCRAWSSSPASGRASPSRQDMVARRTPAAPAPWLSEAASRRGTHPSILAQSDSDVTICGTFDDRTERPFAGACRACAETRPTSTTSWNSPAAPASIRHRPHPDDGREAVLDMLRKLWVLPVDIRLAAHTAKLRFRPRAYSYIGNVPSSTSSTSRSRTGTSS